MRLRGAKIVRLCLGEHVPADAGLLEGRRATTHREYVAAFAACFPAVDVDADVLGVEDANVLTSLALTLTFICCASTWGGGRTDRVARRLVVSPHRASGQPQFIEQPLPKKAGGERLASRIDTVRERVRDPHTLDSLTGDMSMTRCTLTRHF